MKMLHGIFALAAFASAVFFSCSLETKDNNAYAGASSADDSSSSYADDSSSSDDPGISSNSGNANSSSSFQDGISSPSARSSSSSARSSSSAGSNACAYQTSWCGGAAFNAVVTTSQNNAQGEGSVCIFATAITKLGNEYGGDGIRVNGTKLAGANGNDVGGRCGNTDWGQQACEAALANVAKADGGYYIYVQNGGYQDFTTTGGTPSCYGSGVSSASNQQRSSSSGASSSSRASSSSVSSGGSSNSVNYPPLTEGASGVHKGYATRYWDACKASCSWSGKSQALGSNTRCMACEINGTSEIAAKDENMSSCDGGNSYTCFNQVPWSVSNTLSYGFAATPGGGNDCGKCYQLQFTGRCDEKYGGQQCSSVSGKTMIVISSNTGYDVEGGQFDVMIPGGGVGAFDAFSNQLRSLGVNNLDFGAQYGGFLTGCNYSASCVKQRCDSHFGNIPLLKSGCYWFVDWLGAANNPSVLYKEVQCPQELIDKYKATKL
jgi:hypothetical protein